MRLYIIIVLLISIEYINSSCKDLEASSKSDCKEDLLTKEEKEKGYKYCCYFESKKGVKMCTHLKQDNYDKISDYIKSLNDEAKKSGSDDKIKKLDCNSLFLKISFLNLLLFFF